MMILLLMMVLFYIIYIKYIVRCVISLHPINIKDIQYIYYIFIMVSSKLNDDINYKENRSIEEDDMGSSAIIYEMDIEGHPVRFVLGKQKYTFASKNVLYYPMYLLNEDRIKAQIGVVELPANRALNILDEDGDIDLNVLDEPLLYSYITPAFIEKALKPKPGSVSKPADIARTTGSVRDLSGDGLSSKDKVSDSDSDGEDEHLKSNRHAKRAEDNGDGEPSKDTDIVQGADSDSDSDNDDPTNLVVPKTVHLEQVKSLTEKTKNGIFDIDTNHTTPAILPQETESDDKAIKAEFRVNSSQKWIQKYMKNDNYDIVEVESNGNCFFACIREAYKEIGYKTTPEILRAILAKEVPERVFMDQLDFYNSFSIKAKEIENRITSIKKEAVEYKKRIKKASYDEREELLNMTTKLAKELKEKTKEKDDIVKTQRDNIGYMENINTFDDYLEYVQTKSFWADAWAISTIERLTNTKIIIMSEMAFNDKAVHSVLNCGEINAHVQSRGVFNPDYYIMVSYTGNHYRLITYKGKRLFTFREIPYGMKVLIVNKCLEKNAGAFYLIEDFRNFKSKQGIHPDTGNPKKSVQEEEADEKNEDLYDEDTVFMFHQHSEIHKNAGEGSGEKIPMAKKLEYSNLKKSVPWRRMLDDTWANDILIRTADGKEWKSVEHYVQAAKFKNGFPDFYHSFSMKADSELSKDVDYAKAAGESGKLKKKTEDGKTQTIILRPKNVHPDENYNAEEERGMAIGLKLSQNEDVKQILLATRRAKLVHFSRSREGNYLDIPLMELRRRIATSEGK